MNLPRSGVMRYSLNYINSEQSYYCCITVVGSSDDGMRDFNNDKSFYPHFFIDRRTSIT